MTMPTASLPQKPGPRWTSLADVIAKIEADVGLRPIRRRDLIAGVKALCRTVGRHPGDVRADPPVIAQLFSHCSAAQAGLSPQTFRNMRSRVRGALKEAGVAVHAGRQRLISYTPAWKALVERIEDQSMRVGLTRFIRVCVERGWEPEGVDENCFAEFDHILETQAIMHRGRGVSVVARQQWNRAVATISGWPQRRVPLLRVREAYTLSWADLPASLVEEVDALFHRRVNPSLLDAQRPIRSATAEDQKFRLRQAISAMVLKGVDPKTITSLAVALTLDNANKALEFFMERAGRKITLQVYGIAVLLRLIAGHAAGNHNELVEKLKLFIKNNKPKRGLSDKNRARLRPLDDPHFVDALLGLPRTLGIAASKERNPGRQASMVRVALVVEILLHCPIRVGNLVTLTHRHFVRSRSGPEGRVHLVVPAAEVKNLVDLEFELPPTVLDLKDLYFSGLRQVHCGQPSDWIFPTKDGGHVSYKVIGDSLCRYAKRYAGLELNPHLFRHIAAKLYLDAHPGGYEVVRRVHGHTSMDTTTGFYTGMETLAAARHFDETILRLRGDAGGPGSARALNRPRATSGRR
jgi:integrase